MKSPGAILALDIGARRIGFAISDVRQIVASPLENYERQGFEKDADYIAQVCRDREIVRVVVGMPVHLSGAHTRSTRMAQKFIVALQTKVEIPICDHDERFSTLIAERVLIEADLSRAKRKNVIDKMAAVVVLQSYLDTANSGADT